MIKMNFTFSINIMPSLIRGTAFLVLFNAVLISLGIPLSYLFSMVALVLIGMFYKFQLTTLKRFQPEMLYIFCFSILAVMQVGFVSFEMDGLVQLALYIIPLICWIVFLVSRDENYNFGGLFPFFFYLASFVSFLGILQYFLSPTLWGFISYESKAFESTLDKSFAQYSGYFRASSLLGSPQVFGLFCALNLILGHRYRLTLSKNCYFASSLLLFLGGALSGNKLFFLIIFLYALFVFTYQFKLSLKRLMFILTATVFLMLSFDYILENVPMLERIVSIERILDQESGGDGRLDRYAYIFTNTNILIGNGLGQVSAVEHSTLKAAESYIFKIYFEAGVLPMLLFLVFFYSIVKSSYAVSAYDFFIVCLIFLSLVVVHAFQSPAFFTIWGYLLSLKFQVNGSGAMKDEK